MATIATFPRYGKTIAYLNIQSRSIGSSMVLRTDNKPATSPGDASLPAVDVKDKKLHDFSLLSMAPKEQQRGRLARIFVPTKNAMQSGTHGTHNWRIEFDTRERWENPLMGWQSNGDPLSNVNIDFGTKEDAMVFCERNGFGDRHPVVVLGMHRVVDGQGYHITCNDGSYVKKGVLVHVY